MVALQAAILTFLAFAYERFFFSSIQWMKLQFLEKIYLINEALLFFCTSFKIRQSFFDSKEFLKKFASYDGPLSVFKLSLKKYFDNN